MIIECKKKPKDYEPVKGNETKKVMYNGKIMSFTMLVFEVKKNILSNWRGVNGGEM